MTEDLDEDIVSQIGKQLRHLIERQSTSRYKNKAWENNKHFEKIQRTKNSDRQTDRQTMESKRRGTRP